MQRRPHRYGVSGKLFMTHLGNDGKNQHTGEEGVGEVRKPRS